MRGIAPSSHSTRRRLLLAFAGTFAAVALVEVGLRIVDPFHFAARRELERFGATILERDAAGQLHLRANARAELFGHAVRVNSLGFRGAEPAPKAPGTYRILVVGDSVAFGWGVAEDAAFGAVLERRLAADGPPSGHDRIEVVTAAVPGWGIPNYFACLQELRPTLDPDLVVVTLINNDLTDVITALETARGQVMRAPTRTPAWLGWSYLARSMAAAIEALRSGPVRNDYFVDLEGSRDYEAATEHVCTLLGDLHAAAGVPLVVMDTIGARTADGSVAYRVEGLVECLRRRGVPRFDAYLAIPGYAERYAVSPVDHHPNAEGHRQLAEWAYRWIRAHVYP